MNPHKVNIITFDFFFLFSFLSLLVMSNLYCQEFAIIVVYFFVCGHFFIWFFFHYKTLLF